MKRPQIRPKEIDRQRLDPSYVVLAKKFLNQWAREINRGQGVPNILAMLDHIASGERSVWPTAPGPMFSPMAEAADLALRNVRALDVNLAQTLIAAALGYSLQEMADAKGGSKSQAHRDMGPSYGAFAMACMWQTNVREWAKGPPRPRTMQDGDLYAVETL